VLCGAVHEAQQAIFFTFSHQANALMPFRDEDSTQRADVLRRLYFASFLCFTFLIVELLGGYFSRSLAILSDAAHLFSDLASFAIAIIASHLASLPTTDQHTFGLKRSESLAALFSMLSLAIVSIGLAFEAVRRLYTNETPVDGKLMSGVAAIGVFVNVVLAAVLGVENHVHLPGSDHCHDHTHDVDKHDHRHNHEHKPLDGKNHDHVHRHRHHDHDNISEGSHDDDHSHNHDHHSDGSHDDDHSHNHDHHSHRSHEDEHSHSHGHDHHSEESDSDSHHSHSREHDHHHGEKGTDCVASETTKLISGGDKTSHRDEIPIGKAQRNVNLHAAYLHVLSDLAQSVAVLIAGIVIWVRPEWRIVDPICTLLFCALVFYSTLSVIRNAVAVLLEEVPPNINWQKMFDKIQSVEGVQNVHDLHIWSISQNNPSLSVHCSTDRDPQQVLREVYNAVKRQGVMHATIQIQTTCGECITCQGLGCDEARLQSSESFTV
jgi:solute carrier family 30 (zinc transporter), member 2